MLEVGNGDLTSDENRAHFSLWCMLAAPLMMGNDIRKATPETLEILLNKEAIAVNQDLLGRQGRKVRDDGEAEVWSKVLQDGSRAVVLFNRSSKPDEIAVQWTEIGYPSHLKAKVRDIWATRDAGTFSKGYSASVPSHGVVMIRVTP
jgi:alpha-galactosidase